MGWNFYNASGELQINDGGVQAASAVFTGNVDLGSNLLVGNAGSTGIAITANGEITMAAQPCFAAFNGSADSNVTGNNAAATIDFDEEIFDQNADFASDTFTAPITGRYEILTVVRIDGITAASQISNLAIVSSNRTWGSYQQFGTAISPAGNRNGAIVDMDAADTLTIVMTNGGESSDVHDTGGGATHPTSYISGKLVA